MPEFTQWLYESLSAFVILFAVIDIAGSIPLIVGMLDRGQHYQSGVAGVVTLVFLLMFFFLGKGILAFFNVDFSSFAVAGAIVMSALAIEMIFDITVFKSDAPTGSVTIVPLVFPLIAGPGSITTMLSLKSMYDDGPIIAQRAGGVHRAALRADSAEAPGEGWRIRNAEVLWDSAVGHKCQADDRQPDHHHSWCHWGVGWLPFLAPRLVARPLWPWSWLGMLEGPS